MMSSQHCFLLEFKSIQAFLLLSGRLRHIVGASELIDRLTSKDCSRGLSLLDAVLEAVNGREQIKFSRRAGGAVYAFSEDASLLQRFAAVYSLGLQQVAPGLAYALGWGTGPTHADAFAAARQNLQSHDSLPLPEWPAASPLTQRARRTGLAAVSRSGKDGEIDAATVSRQRFANPENGCFLRRFSPKGSGVRDSDWPLDLSASEADEDALVFPYVGERRDLALIVADGNGMGQILQRLQEAAKKRPDRFIELYQAFSKAIDVSSTAAAAHATQTVLLPARKPGECLPARPILLGGDDVTVLVRADLAMDYVRAYAQQFEQQSAQALGKLAELDVQGLPDKLTIGFGVAFIGANQPFHQAHHLAETLMAATKKDAKSAVKSGPGGNTSNRIAPSTVAFYRNTSALNDDYDDALNTVLSHHDGQITFVHTLGSYTLSETAGGLPALDDLLALGRLLRNPNLGRGSLRGLLTLIEMDPSQARTIWRRWREVLRQRDRRLEADIRQTLGRLIAAKMGDGAHPVELDDLPFGPALADKNGKGRRYTALGDVITLIDVQTNLLAAQDAPQPSLEPTA